MPQLENQRCADAVRVVRRAADAEGKGVRLGKAAADVRGGEEAYLSLLILHRTAQGRGMGRRCAALLEDHLRAGGSRRVRIDVVDDHPGNPLPFWRRLGYEGSERVALTWGEKTSSALVLRKEL